MITPKFSCSQDDASVVVSIYVPSVRASEVEIHVEETLLSVHINPYFLRLNFPGNVVEDDDSSANYDPSSGYLTVRLTKETKGEHFADLDLLAKLLAPKVVTAEEGKAKGPLIEVIGSEPDNHDDSEELQVEQELTVDEDLAEQTRRLHLNQERELFLEAERNDWRLPQDVPSTSASFQTTMQKTYGFLDLHSGYFRHASHSENEVTELGEAAETLTVEERVSRRFQHENKKWDEEYYMADFVNDEEIQALIKWKNPILTLTPDFEFTEEENMTMMRLPRREYIISPSQSRDLCHILATLIFSYAYDSRTTLGDPTSESAWTLSVLTPSFSSLSLFLPSESPSIEGVFRASYRRALAFPLHRSWSLCEQCRLDAAQILGGGKRMVLRVLLSMKKILDEHDVYYVYSKIWLDDFCVWIQSGASDETLQAFAKEARDLRLAKASIGWMIEELEEATRGLDPDSDDESEDDAMRPAPL